MFSVISELAVSDDDATKFSNITDSTESSWVQTGVPRLLDHEKLSI